MRNFLVPAATSFRTGEIRGTGRRARHRSVRRVLAPIGAFIVVSSCGAPTPSPHSVAPVPTTTAAASLATTPAASLATTPPAPVVAVAITVFNRSHTSVVVSATTDVAGRMAGFRSGERGTISIDVSTPNNGVGVEVLDAANCAALVTESYPSRVPFTLFVDDGSGGSRITLTTAAEPSAGGFPLPSNGLHCPGG